MRLGKEVRKRQLGKGVILLESGRVFEEGKGTCHNKICQQPVQGINIRITKDLTIYLE